ncbi:hypothetical protein HP1_038 [Candidatus Termititenax spirochaetophilus]|uniref:Uncharacterized protein n=1 Tax=Candidatus Termititenax spirochaetophilus TaxID=2218522 RepID=A0A388T6H0_9BACT|nr:hypothetical protein HP1_038 [Candidatus Termititenax spirochaetophilus]
MFLISNGGFFRRQIDGDQVYAVQFADNFLNTLGTGGAGHTSNIENGFHYMILGE